MTDVQRIISHGIEWDNHAFNRALSLGVIDSISNAVKSIIDDLTAELIFCDFCDFDLTEEFHELLKKDNYLFFLYGTFDGLHIAVTTNR